MAEDSKAEFDEYGEIKLPEGSKVDQLEPIGAVIDADDLPENQGKRPSTSIAELKARLDSTLQPVDINNLIKGTPPSPDKTPK